MRGWRCGWLPILVGALESGVKLGGLMVNAWFACTDTAHEVFGATGIMRFIKSANSGTVKAVSPCAGL